MTQREEEYEREEKNIDFSDMWRVSNLLLTVETISFPMMC